MSHFRRHISKSTTRILVGTVALVLAGVLPDPALAQRPFRVHDPFYRGETARRAFFDGYAFTAEVSYRTPGSIQDGQTTLAQDPLGLSFRLDYQLLPSVDIGAVLDASGSNTGRTVGISWLTVKYYQTQENTDYAFRLAVDPAIGGRMGAPQVDLAFISTTLLSPSVSSDYAVGARRVRVGYEQLIPSEAAGYMYTPGLDDTPFPSRPTPDIIYTRALGWEMHGMMQYSFLLNPARNNLFISALAYVGQYDIIETSLDGGTPSSGLETGDGTGESAAPQASERRGGGAIWIRSGIEYNRPSFQLMPFLNFALKRWVSADSEASPRLSVGLRFMLR